MRGFGHRQRMQQSGLRREDVVGRPIVAIVNTWSDLSPCHAHLRERAEAVKRGVLLAGGMPLEAARKDSVLALQLAQSLGVPLFAIQASHAVYEMGVAAGYGREDYAAVARLWADWGRPAVPSALVAGKNS